MNLGCGCAWGASAAAAPKRALPSKRRRRVPRKRVKFGLLFPDDEGDKFREQVGHGKECNIRRTFDESTV